LTVAAALLVAFAAALTGLLVARFSGARGFPVADLRQGVTAANLQITPVFVVKRGGAVLVLRPFAPGGTVPVGWCPTQRFFEDPVTGTKYDEAGGYVAGPPTRGLDRLSSKIVDGVLQIAPDVVTPGAAPGAAVASTERPPCDWSRAVFAPGVAPPPSPTPEP
jgi:hypothetical protein